VSKDINNRGRTGRKSRSSTQTTGNPCTTQARHAEKHIERFLASKPTQQLPSGDKTKERADWTQRRATNVDPPIWHHSEKDWKWKHRVVPPNKMEVIFILNQRGRAKGHISFLDPVGILLGVTSKSHDDLWSRRVPKFLIRQDQEESTVGLPFIRRPQPQILDKTNQLNSPYRKIFRCAKFANSKDRRLYYSH
jgi:hypothetical protein